MDLPSTNDQRRRSFKGNSWSQTYALLLNADREKPLESDSIYTLALAAYLTGKDSESVDLLTRAHHQFLTEGNVGRALHCGFWIGMQLMFKGESGRSSGWFARAKRLMEDFQHDCVEKGLLLIPEGLRSLNEGDPDKAYLTFQQAADMGSSFNDPDLNTLSLLGRGQALIQMGKISDGVTMLDEAMVAVESDKIYPIVVGIVYCAVIETCQQIYDLSRAKEWTALLSHWCESQPDLVPFRGQCLIRRSQIMHLHGAWPEALDEMQRACEFLSQPPGGRAAGEAYYQLAEFYLLRGEIAHAELAYSEANKWGRKPQPGLSKLRLAQNQSDAAKVSIQIALDEAKNLLSRIGILPAYIEIMLTAGYKQEAHYAADELSIIAEKCNAPFIHAISAYSQGSVLLAEEDACSALKVLRKAWVLWNELDAPYEAARVRLLIGLAYRKEGDEDSASMEWTAAQWVFQELKAIPDYKRANALIKCKSGCDVKGLTLRELQVVRLVAEGDTNKSISTKLFISERTVERHVSNIFNKLGVNSRTAATAYAFNHKLL
jgi:DNA-binding CsgD family transcriptional regulator/tetratricopeptide (TPR) repeat protein